jgi:hypothetical protein
VTRTRGKPWEAFHPEVKRIPQNTRSSRNKLREGMVQPSLHPVFLPGIVDPEPAEGNHAARRAAKRAERSP